MIAASRFPPPWTVEETDARFIVRDDSGQKLAYVYFEERAGTALGGQDEARRIAANVAKLPELLLQVEAVLTVVRLVSVLPSKREFSA